MFVDHGSRRQHRDQSSEEQYSGSGDAQVIDLAQAKNKVREWVDGR
jgi:hypothetical protein